MVVTCSHGDRRGGPQLPTRASHQPSVGEDAVWATLMSPMSHGVRHAALTVVATQGSWAQTWPVCHLPAPSGAHAGSAAARPPCSLCVPPPRG